MAKNQAARTNGFGVYQLKKCINIPYGSHQHGIVLGIFPWYFSEKRNKKQRQVNQHKMRVDAKPQGVPL
jgi:hypothetical protein